MQSSASSELPEDLATCQAIIQQLPDTHVEKDHLIAGLQHQLKNLLQRTYGRSSEKLDPNQLALFEKMLAELQQAPATPTEQLPVDCASKANVKGHGRRQLPASLERRSVVIDIPEDQKPCPCCHAMRESMGKEVSEKLDYEPARVFVRQEIRKKYVCRACEVAAAEGGPQIVTADRPLSPIENALCVYTTDGELNIDNNISEHALRRIAVGRYNWTFLGSDTGGHTAAVLFALVATCERHRVNPFEYLRDVLTRIAAHPMNHLADPLPNRWQPATR